VPGSRFEQIEILVDLMVRLQPSSILDVGVGNGLYGLLARQYVDESGPFADEGLHLEGIEIFEGYLTDVQRTIYDRIHVGDALAILPEMEGRAFDLAIALDVIEHLPDPRGDELLRDLLRVSRTVVITSPRGDFPQGEMYGNVHETHVSTWPPARLRAAGAALIVPHPFVSIALFTKDREFVRYYHRYLMLKRASVLAPVGLVARMTTVDRFRKFALRRAGGER